MGIEKTKSYKKVFMTFIMLMSVVTIFIVVNPILIKAESETEIPNNHLRIHFENEELKVSDLRLWLYGDVAVWSEEENSWPNGKQFPENQISEYGPYVDVELIEDSKFIEMIMIYENEKLLDAIKINIISENMDEVWISREGNVSVYEPVNLPDNTIRLHYYSEDTSYEPWGVWTWGDVLEPSEEKGAWPLGAEPLLNNQVGKYGAYIDLEITENARNMNFLFANRSNESEQFGNYSYSDFKNNNQIFLHERDEEIYINPYYVKEKKESIVSQTKIPEWSKDSVIYEVNVRQYSEEGTFTAFQEHLPRLKELGVDILWFMPIHPISEKNRIGTLGSYYSIQDYTKVNPEYGTMEDFKSLVKTAQDMGFYVVLDWVANHTGWDHPWISEYPDWYVQNSNGEIISPVEFNWTDVAQLNYQNENLRKEMKDIMSFWVSEVGVDGFRADYASGVPVDFWEEASDELNKHKPIFMLAEDNRVYDLLNKAFFVNWGWDLHHIMNDIAKGSQDKSHVISYFEKAKEMYPIGTYPMQFITSHDENSWEGTIQERLGDAADAMAALYFTVPGLPLIYSGQEAGLNKRLDFFEKDEIDWSNLTKQTFYEELIQLKKNNEALWNGTAGGDIHFLPTSNEHVLAFEREKNGNKVLVIINLSNNKVSTTVNDGLSAGEYKSYFPKAEYILEENQTIDLEAWDYLVLTIGEKETEEPGEPQEPGEPEESNQDKDLEQLKDLINNLTNRIDEMKNSTNTDIKNLTQKINNLEKEIKAIEEKYKGLPTSNVELVNNLNVLRMEIENLKGQLSNSNDLDKEETGDKGTSSDKEEIQDKNDKENSALGNGNSQDSNKGGKKLPATATPTVSIMLAGLILLTTGLILYFVRSNKKKIIMK